MRQLKILVAATILIITFGSSAASVYESCAVLPEPAGREIVSMQKSNAWAASSSTTIPLPFAVRVATVDLTNPAWGTLAKNAGVRWATTDVSWADAYASQPPTVGGAFRSPLTYGGLTNLMNAGFTVVVGIRGTPSAWLLDPSKPLGPIRPEYYNEFGRFLTALVNQYKDRVKYWQINFGYWEFDAFQDWGCYAKEYADVIKIAGPAIHAADPSAVVVLGPLAYDWWNSATYNATCEDPGAGVFNRTFLDTVVQNGAAPYFDAISFNFYHRLVGIGPNKPWATGPGKAKALRDKLPPDQRNKTFLITEMGEPYAAEPGVTTPGNGPSTPTPEMSARAVAQMYAQILSGSDPIYGVSGIQIDAAFWMSFDTYSPNPNRIYGLVSDNSDPNGSLLPGYYAYQTATAELAGATFKELFNQSRVEGYVFDLPGGGTKTVVWAKDRNNWWDAPPVTVTFSGTGLRIVDKLGNPIAGTETGGQTLVQVTSSPIYVGPIPVVQSCDPWDIASPSGTVDIADLMEIVQYWHATTFPAEYDFNLDSKIDIRDIAQLAAHMGPCL